jgi:all-trans-8'-apo-beta-carotenal 15,15'-oxygenase
MNVSTVDKARHESVRKDHGWQRAFEDLPREHGFEPLRIVGTLPDDLLGTFYWNGPGLLSAFGEPYGHWFDGDGAVGALRFGGGRARGAVTLVQTSALAAERSAGKRLYSRALLRSPRPLREWFRGQRRNPTNVNVVMHDHKLLALGIGRPVEISPDDLSTLGALDPDDVLLANFCAHPHWHAARRALYGFGLLLGRKNAIEVYELRGGARTRRLVTIPLEQPAFVHDCYVTESHVVIVVPPLRFRVLPMLLNLLPVWRALEWRPELGTEILVVPIDAPDRVKRMRLPGFFAFHVANAYEERGRMTLDLPCTENWALLGGWLEALAQGRSVPAPDNHTRRIAVDLAQNRATFEPIVRSVGEMPRVSPRVEGTRHRFVYHVGFRPGSDGAPNLLHKVDVDAGRTHAIDLGRDAYPSEPVVVPRAGGRSEDDAYLLTVVYDGATHTSHVAVLGAARPDAKPLARVHFDHHVPLTFHGAWVAAASAPAP